MEGGGEGMCTNGGAAERELGKRRGVRGQGGGEGEVRLHAGGGAGVGLGWYANVACELEGCVRGQERAMWRHAARGTRAGRRPTSGERRRRARGGQGRRWTGFGQGALGAPATLRDEPR